jgi:lipoic acid synthetase
VSAPGGRGGDTPDGHPTGGPGPKPEWLKKRLPNAASLQRMDGLLRERRLHTVCESALCPNLGECFARGTATFLILGDVCTRDCGFCGVATGVPGPADPTEPENVAEAVARLKLSHAVVTSVTRDDLADGGAAHYAATIRAIRDAASRATVEVLVPDFEGRTADVDVVLAERPEVFNHNVETASRLNVQVRPQAVYERSLKLLEYAASRTDGLTKTGFMVGLGETGAEVRALLQDLAGVGVAMVTIGQYLRPSRLNLPVVEYVRPEVFETYREWGEALGLQVHSAPFVRSSFQAGESFAQAMQSAAGSSSGER